MQTPAAAWTTAVQLTKTQGRLSGSYQPIVLLDLLAVNRTFGTRAYAPGGPLFAGNGVLAGNGALCGGALAAAETLIASLGSTSLQLNEAADTVQVGGMTATLLNQEDLVGSFEPTPLDNTLIRVRLGFVGLGPSEFLPVFMGALDRVPVTQEQMVLSILDPSLRQARTLSIPIGGQYFPGAPQASRSQNIPIVLGVVIDAPTIQVAGAASGSLGLAMGTGGSVAYLTEYGAPFPATGTVSIGAETGVTYTGRHPVTVSGTTYLQLTGLTRGAPTTHAVAEAVTLTSVAYVYLIGYEIAALNAVRNDGVIVAPAGYTLSTTTADRRVSLLTFASQQGTVTVDVNAGNVDTASLFTNGGFETGDGTGWTLANGGTLVVGTTSPLPYLGAYRAALTGGVASYGDLYQEWGTIIGEDYRVEFVYQNADNNMLTNGGFEDGALTGWTVDTLGIVTPRAAWSVVEDQTVVSTALSAQQYTAPEGSYLALVTPSSPAPYRIGLYQDVTTVIGVTYLFRFMHLSTEFRSFSEGGIPGGDRAGLAGYRIGTTTAPQSIVGDTMLLPTWRILEGVSGGIGFTSTENTVQAEGLYSTAEVSFVATATTTRVTLLAMGTGDLLGHLMAGLPVGFDGVALYASAEVDGSSGAYKVGSTESPANLFDVELPIRFRWTRHQATFRALAETTRLTLRSKYASASRATFYDDVKASRVFTLHAGSGGQNPSEAIAYIIDTFLGASRDTESFTTAYRQLLNWKFGASLANPGDSKALLQRMAQQCNSIIYIDAQGRYRLVVLDDARTTQRGFEVSNIVKDTWARVPESLDTLATEIYVWFGAKTGGSTSSDDFQGVTYATPLASTHPAAGSLSAQCARAQTLTGHSQRVDIYADFIADLYTANLLLEWAVKRRTTRHERLTFRTWLDAAPLQIGDVVQVQHPSLPRNGTPVLGEVVGTALDWGAMQVGLTIRTLRPASWGADFEYAPTLAGSDGWASDFEYAATGSQSGAGWVAEFEEDVLRDTRRILERCILPWWDDDPPSPQRGSRGGSLFA